VKKSSLDFKGTRVKKFLTKKNIARWTVTLPPGKQGPGSNSIVG
jgi:hypothetical protein